MSTTTVNAPVVTTTGDSARYQYLVSEDGGHKFRTVAIVDGGTREQIESVPVTDPGFVRMFGRLS